MFQNGVDKKDPDRDDEEADKKILEILQMRHIKRIRIEKGFSWKI